MSRTTTNRNTTLCVAALVALLTTAMAWANAKPKSATAAKNPPPKSASAKSPSKNKSSSSTKKSAQATAIVKKGQAKSGLAFQSAVNQSIGTSLKGKENTEEGYAIVIDGLKGPLNNLDTKAAAAHIKRYAPLFTQAPWSLRFRTLIGLLEAPAEKIELHNLGAPVNGPQDDYMPILSFDEHTLWFTAKGRRSDNPSGEEIFSSTWADGAWSTPRSLESSVNPLDENKALVAVNSLNTELYLWGHFPGTMGHGDVFLSKKKNGSWSQPEPLPAPINSEWFDGDAFLTSDGKALLFASDRPGAVGTFQARGTLGPRGSLGGTGGNTDLWVCLRTPEGWSKPINLGEALNTPFSERTPFLHADGKTLYFSSDGHAGFGGLDVFKTERLDDTWQKWSPPVNLGRQVNTPGTDWGYRINTAGTQALFASNQRPGGLGGHDIWTITLPKAARPTEALVSLRGRVLDASTRKGLEAQITWHRPGETETHPASVEEGGQFFVPIPELKGETLVQAQLDGYWGPAVSVKHLYVKTSSNSLAAKKAELVPTEIFANLVLIPESEFVEKGLPLTLSQMQFQARQAEIPDSALPELEELIRMAQKYPTIKIEIAAHTDGRGKPAQNLQISEERARLIVSWLVDHGIPRSQISGKGYGSTQPLLPETSEANMSKNRRIEVRFSKPKA